MDVINHKVLIVEDEVSLLKALSQKFKEDGFEVFEAQNGIEGLKQVEKHEPHMILLDIAMPKMDGIKFMQKLRGDEKNTDTKVIILTNYQADDRIISGLAGTNPSYYLVKSEWNISDIIGKVREVLASE
ncbi:MAG: response regulator [Candidatus Dojkabacteria bacterium]